MMFTFFESVLSQRRLVLTLAAIITLAGSVMWMTMVRQEDPRLPDFWGQIIAPYPGADAETVEQRLLEPIEDALVGIDDIDTIQSTAFSEMAVIVVELRGGTRDVDKVWEEIRLALQKAQRDFPASVPLPSLDKNQMDQDAVVLAVSGSSDPLVLLQAARRIKKDLQKLPDVSQVHFIADPLEQVTIELDDAAANRLGLSPAGLVQRLSARNSILPGGSIKMGDRIVRLRPVSEFQSFEEIADTTILLQNGSAVPLSEIANVRIGPAEPASARMRFNGEMCVGISIVPRKAINLVDFGEQVQTLLDRIRPRFPHITIQEVTFQPRRTKARLSELNQSLILGILIIGGVLITFMGIRMGLMVALIVPVVAMASIAVFAAVGGVLHQISIATLVISLGLLVDNAIVVSENVQWRIDRGIPGNRAGVEAVTELARPLAGATATTLAAFVPMLIAKGPTAEFTRSIPIVIMLTLTVSYLFAVTVTPSLAALALRPSTVSNKDILASAGTALARLATRRPGWILCGALLVVATAALLAGHVERQFFPTSDRNQFTVDLKLAEGTHLDTTDAVTRKLESGLLQRPHIRSVASFMGRSAPHFYYNISRVPFSPHFAQLIVETHTPEQIDEEVVWLRRFMAATSNEVEIVARKLEQGPPVNAPVEIRLFSDDLNDLSTAAGKVRGLLSRIPGTQDVRHDLDYGAPTLRFHINDAAAGRYGVSRAQVAQQLYGHTRGLPAGQLFVGKNPIAVVVRSSGGEKTTPAVLDNIDISNQQGQSVPLSQIARTRTDWRPTVIKHYNTSRVATVSSQLAETTTFSQILAQLQPKLNEVQLPASVTIGIGGDAEGSGQANMALMKSFPIGLLLLFGVLLAEFNSFRRLAIILVTVPLAAVGVIPGLLIAGQPFGFMSMLGVIALVGIVVNNAIVLIELIDAQRKEGKSISEAIEIGVARRIRPILLTSATTIAGLLPMLFSQSTLWPPLASAMISGLMASTLLTLAVVPALYRLMLTKSPQRQEAVA